MKVHHVRDNDFTIYIGRPSVFGNPFIIGTHGTRTECIKKFKRYALRNERVLNAIGKLKRNAILGCHCAPKACHGDVIVAIKKTLTREAKQHAKVIADSKRSASVSGVPRKSKSDRDLHGVQGKRKRRHRKER